MGPHTFTNYGLQILMGPQTFYELWAPSSNGSQTFMIHGL